MRKDQNKLEDDLDKKDNLVQDITNFKQTESLPKIEGALKIVIGSSSIQVAPQIGTERRIKRVSRANLSNRVLDPVRSSLAELKKKKDLHLAGGDTYLP